VKENENAERAFLEVLEFGKEEFENYQNFKISTIK